MKTSIVILILILGTELMCQDEVNQRTDDGLKDGVWIEYIEDGRIDRMMEYLASYIATNEAYEQRVQDNFFIGRRLPARDTVLNKDGLLWLENYIYDSDKNLRHIQRIDEVGDRVSYLFGTAKEVELDSIDYSVKGRAGEVQRIGIIITNKSGVPIEARSTNTVKGVSLSTVRIAPEATGVIEGVVTIKDGEHRLQLKVEAGTTIVECAIQSYGYSLRSEDVQESARLKLPRVFSYLRPEREALITVLDIESKEALKRVPLSTQNTLIDLSDLPIGKYLLVKTNFESDERITCYLELVEP